jgi:hypothetical protein
MVDAADHPLNIFLMDRGLTVIPFGMLQEAEAAFTKEKSMRPSIRFKLPMALPRSSSTYRIPLREVH